MNFLNNKRLTILVTVGFLMAFFFTILFLKFYSDNYGTIKSNEEELLEEALLPTESNIEEEVPKINYDNITSVFDRDLQKKESGKVTKTLTNTGTKELNKEITKTVKNEILRSLYTDNLTKATEDANYVKENYDFSNEEFEDFELFIYEVLHNLSNYSSSMTVKQKSSLISTLRSPELILLVFNKSSMNDRMTLAENKHSELFTETITNYIGLTYIGSGTEGVETCGADNVFFITSGYTGHYIEFSTLLGNYKLYYLTDKSTDNNIIMGIDNLDGEYTTIKEYQNIYG